MAIHLEKVCQGRYLEWDGGGMTANMPRSSLYVMLTIRIQEGWLLGECFTHVVRRQGKSNADGMSKVSLRCVRSSMKIVGLWAERRLRRIKTFTGSQTCRDGFINSEVLPIAPLD